MSKYQPLAAHLARLDADEWRPTTHELERILGFELPAGAMKAPWWKNSDQGHAATWTGAGWEVDAEHLDAGAGFVPFRRVTPVAETRSYAPQDADDAAAEEVFRHEGGGRAVARYATGGAVAVGLIGVALGLATMGLRNLINRGR